MISRKIFIRLITKLIEKKVKSEDALDIAEELCSMIEEEEIDRPSPPEETRKKSNSDITKEIKKTPIKYKFQSDTLNAKIPSGLM